MNKLLIIGLFLTCTASAQPNSALNQLRSEAGTVAVALPHAPKAISVLGKSERSKFDANFVKCFDLYHLSYSGRQAADTCLEAALFQFINNPEFDICHEAYRHSLSSATAADICIALLTGKPRP